MDISAYSEPKSVEKDTMAVRKNNSFLPIFFSAANGTDTEIHMEDVNDMLEGGGRGGRK
jgi:hypothetical protein